MIPRPHPADDPAPSQPELDAVLARVAGREEAALAALYDLTCAQVHGVAIRILGDTQAAEEVTVEVFHRAWQGAAGFDPARGSVLSWLLTAARNCAIDRLRARTRDADRTEPVEAAAAVCDPRPGPSRVVSDQQRGAAVRQALATLPPEQVAVIELAFFEGLSHSGIATRLDLPLGTVKTRIRTGIRRLSELLQQLEEFA